MSYLVSKRRHHAPLLHATIRAVAAGTLVACSDATVPTALSRNDRATLAANGDGSLAVTSVIGLEPLDQALNQGEARGVNDGGQVVGSSRDVDGTHAVVWDNTPFPEILPMPVGVGESVAKAINNTGTIVGASTINGTAVATRWVKVNGAWKGIVVEPVPPNLIAEVALGVGDDGSIVGYSETTSGLGGFIWQNGVRRDLGLVDIMRVDGVANRSLVAGTTVGFVAAIWSPAAGVTELGTLGGTSSSATDVNASGVVSGTSSLSNGSKHAFRWTSKNGLTDLGTFGGSSSFGNAISDFGQIVGSSETSFGAEHAAMWLKGKALDLGALPGYVDSKAFGISNSNQIVGVSIAPGGIRATKWTVK